MRRLWPTMLVLLLGYGDPAPCAAQASGARGLVIEVEEDRRILVLETRAGRREVSVAAGAAVHEDHGRRLTLPDVRPGDVVAYRDGTDGVTDLKVARQFWALPADN